MIFAFIYVNVAHFCVIILQSSSMHIFTHTYLQSYIFVIHLPTYYLLTYQDFARNSTLLRLNLNKSNKIVLATSQSHTQIRYLKKK